MDYLVAPPQAKAEVKPESRMPHSPPKGPGIADPPAPQGPRQRLTPRPPRAKAEVNPLPPKAKAEVNPPPSKGQGRGYQIGRASCRERV